MHWLMCVRSLYDDKKLLGTILLCAGLVVQSLPVQAAVLEPRECPKDLKYLLGMYYGNGEQFVIRERNGELNFYTVRPVKIINLQTAISFR